MKRLLGENASSGLKSANGPGLAVPQRGGSSCAAAGEERSEEESYPVGFVAQDSRFSLKNDVKVEKYDPM
ncbi:hypothetical protein NWF24_14640 [Variovorax paradoxus]|uniref:hypothetical protein n=1 Tax=Variovorax paradoxus TaxID=34073 RepID=UPI0021AD0E9B|nr:hypothetical protein [Variovorax paradoxus]UVH60599.1 hypothetical protein NWF24_14640 [Variovorax paradoxus]